MTFFELYKQDKERFMTAIIEQLNWARIARLLDKDAFALSADFNRLPFSDQVFAELRIPLLDAIHELEASTDNEPARQAADDVVNQSRRQDANS